MQILYQFNSKGKLDCILTILAEENIQRRRDFSMLSENLREELIVHLNGSML